MGLLDSIYSEASTGLSNLTKTGKSALSSASNSLTPHDMGTIVVTGKREGVDGISTPYDYSLKDVSLFSTNGAELILKPSMVELSLFEDLFAPTMSGYCMVIDAQGFLEKYDISGFNYIKISFSKTSSEDSPSFDKVFRVYKTSVRTQTNRGTEEYSLQFCSEELFLSEQYKILKSFKNETISNMVKYIFDEMKISEETKQGAIEETEGTYDFIIPNLKPFEAINWLATYAKPSNGNPGSDMIFYENNAGFHFRSLQSLFAKTPKINYTYSPVNITKDRKDLNIGVNNIISYRVKDTFNTLNAVMNGAFANKVMVIDPILRSYDTTEFKYDEYFDSSQKMNYNTLNTGLANRKDETVSDTTSAVFKLAIGNTGQREQSFISEESARYESVASDIDIQTFASHRTAQLTLANYSKLEITVPGNPLLTVGKTVMVNLPSLTNDNSQQMFINNMDSGVYLVAAVRHKIDARGSYLCTAELIKESLYGDRIMFEDNQVTRELREI